MFIHAVNKAFKPGDEWHPGANHRQFVFLAKISGFRPEIGILLISNAAAVKVARGVNTSSIRSIDEILFGITFMIARLDNWMSIFLTFCSDLIPPLAKSPS